MYEAIFQIANIYQKSDMYIFLMPLRFSQQTLFLSYYFKHSTASYSFPLEDYTLPAVKSDPTVLHLHLSTPVS